MERQENIPEQTGFGILDPAAWMSFFEFCCGLWWPIRLPGKEVADGTGRMDGQPMDGDRQRPVEARIGPLELICLGHDLACQAATGQPEQTGLIRQADLKLRQDLRRLDWSELSADETGYALLIDRAFAAKAEAADAQEVLEHILKEESQALGKQGAAARIQAGLAALGHGADPEPAGADCRRCLSR